MDSEILRQRLCVALQYVALTPLVVAYELASYDGAFNPPTPTHKKRNASSTRAFHYFTNTSQ
jgi:hypothetical protein